MFSYKSDSQEQDIEYLSDPNSTSNPGDGSRPMHYTNQATDGNPEHKTIATGPSPSDATTAFHEYRIDWIPGSTMYYLDGVLQKTMTTNVPTQGGSWIWNNWA
jgi:beta-glucanase (GH16 family)